MTSATVSKGKASWPLVALAALAFVPGLGFIFGAVAVTWGLVSDRPRARLAIGLGAAGAFLNLIGAIVFSFALKDNPIMRQARDAATQQDLVKVVFALERYRGSRARYPSDLQELVGRPVPTTLLNIYDQSAGLGVIPRLYQYERSADSSSYDLFAVGSDGRSRTADDLRPAIPDSLLSQTGYHPVAR